ncbi:MAG: hypothetical protein LBS57_03025 [Treponema sp.]|jgi:hypothetical protein|nr:hypothetical protein [Treponema sp.]
MDNMTLTDASYKVDNIVDGLFASFDKGHVEEVFDKYDIKDKEERVKLLRKCMRVIDTSNVTDVLSVDDEYSDELEIFAEGSWRFLI